MLTFYISLDMCPTLYPTLVMVTTNRMVYSVLIMFVGIFLHDALAAFHQPMEFTQFCKPMGPNHAIKLISTGNSTCHSTLAHTIEVDNKMHAHV